MIFPYRPPTIIFMNAYYDVYRPPYDDIYLRPLLRYPYLSRDEIYLPLPRWDLPTYLAMKFTYISRDEIYLHLPPMRFAYVSRDEIYLRLPRRDLSISLARRFTHLSCVRGDLPISPAMRFTCLPRMIYLPPPWDLPTNPRWDLTSIPKLELTTPSFQVYLPSYDEV